MSTYCWALPKPKFEPFITHNRGTLNIIKSKKFVEQSCVSSFLKRFPPVCNNTEFLSTSQMKSPAITTTLDGKNKTLYLQVRNILTCTRLVIFSSLRLGFSEHAFYAVAVYF